MLLANIGKPSQVVEKQSGENKLNQTEPKTKMRIIYCIVPREDSKGVFYTIDSVTKGGSGGSTAFEQKPSTEEIKAHLSTIYPEMTESTWHVNTAQTPEEIVSLYF